MLRHIGFRFVQLLFVMMIVSLVIFVLMKLAPGDPVLAILKANEGAVTISDQNAVRTELGLEMPLYKQFGSWLKGVVTFDLGRSYMNNRDVWDILMERLPATVSLTIGAFIVLLLISVPLGVLAAQHQGRLPDHISRFVALIGSSIPSFWLGLLLIYVFSYQLNWLPTMGKGSLSHLILPSITLGFVMAPEYIRLLRAGLLETLSDNIFVQPAHGDSGMEHHYETCSSRSFVAHPLGVRDEYRQFDGRVSRYGIVVWVARFGQHGNGGYYTAELSAHSRVCSHFGFFYCTC